MPPRDQMILAALKTRGYGRTWFLKLVTGQTTNQARASLKRLERAGLVERDPQSAVNDTLWRPVADEAA